MQPNYQRMACVAMIALSLGIATSGCSIFRATGRSVEAVGEGAGHAVSGTGRAISDAASETKRTLTGK